MVIAPEWAKGKIRVYAFLSMPTRQKRGISLSIMAGTHVLGTQVRGNRFETAAGGRSTGRLELWCGRLCTWHITIHVQEFN